MPVLTKEALLGASDLTEREIDLPSLGGSVRIRALSAAFSNEVFERATEVKTDAAGEIQMTVNPGKYQFLQVLHGLVDPKLDSLEEVQAFAEHVGSAWKTLIEALDEISEIGEEAVKDADTSFRVGGQAEESGSVDVDEVGSGDGGPDLRVRAGVAAGDVGD